MPSRQQRQHTATKDVRHISEYVDGLEIEASAPAPLLSFETDLEKRNHVQEGYQGDMSAFSPSAAASASVSTAASRASSSSSSSAFANASSDSASHEHHSTEFGDCIYHRVVTGDSLRRLSLCYDVRIPILKRVNNLWHDKDLPSRKELLIPLEPELYVAELERKESEKKTLLCESLQARYHIDEETALLYLQEAAFDLQRAGRQIESDRVRGESPHSRKSSSTQTHFDLRTVEDDSSSYQRAPLVRGVSDETLQRFEQLESDIYEL